MAIPLAALFIARVVNGTLLFLRAVIFHLAVSGEGRSREGRKNGWMDGRKKKEGRQEGNSTVSQLEKSRLFVPGQVGLVGVSQLGGRLSVSRRWKWQKGKGEGGHGRR